MRHCVRLQATAAVSRSRYTQMKREICPNDPSRVNHSVPFKSDLHRFKKTSDFTRRYIRIRRITRTSPFLRVGVLGTVALIITTTVITELNGRLVQEIRQKNLTD